jgi:hypothetical protein
MFAKKCEIVAESICIGIAISTIVFCLVLTPAEILFTLVKMPNHLKMMFFKIFLAFLFFVWFLQSIADHKNELKGLR